jgi:hypothetical protein
MVFHTQKTVALCLFLIISLDICLSLRSILILSTPLCLDFPSCVIPHAFFQKLCVHYASLQCMLHALSISSFILLSKYIFSDNEASHYAVFSNPLLFHPSQV